MEQEKAVASCANVLTTLRRHLSKPPSLFDRHEATELLESLVRLARTQAQDKTLWSVHFGVVVVELIVITEE